MRLINADKLQDYFWDNRSKLFQSKDCRTAIDNAPTVKAIPIEWLDRYVCNITKEEKLVIDKMFIKWVGEENDN